MKICADCWFVSKTDFIGNQKDGAYWTCGNTTKQNPVTGLIEKTFCTVERMDIGEQCGPEGQFFVDYKERADEINDGEHEKIEPFHSVDRCNWEEDYESATE